MVNAPSPGFIRNPCPANNRIPGPSSIEIGSPVIDMDLGDPDIAIRSFINPIAIIGQFSFIFIELRGKVTSSVRFGQERVSGLIPAGKIIIASIKVSRFRSKLTVCSNKLFLSLD